jgi:hypothetical protein
VGKSPWGHQVENALLIYFSRAFFWFAQRSWQTRLVERYGRHPDQGEDNPNRKGVAGNGRV